MEKIQKRIRSKHEMLKNYRTEIKQKDQNIEFFEFLMREKQRSINSLNA